MGIKQIIVYNFYGVNYSFHGLIIYAIRTVDLAVVDVQGGGVRTLQKFGEHRNQRNKSL